MFGSVDAVLPLCYLGSSEKIHHQAKGEARACLCPLKTPLQSITLSMGCHKAVSFFCEQTELNN